MVDRLRYSPPTSSVLRAALTFLSFGLGLTAGCYSERLPPPAYRYPCDADQDCDDGQSCVLGLCEYRCSFDTFETACPAAGNYLACINGLCANGCTVGTDTCPDLMECIDLSGLGLDLSGGSNSPLPSSSNEGTQGVCGRMCEMGGDTCPSGEVCILGFCTPECEPGDPTACGNGLECSVTLGVCAPPGIDSAGDDAPPMTDDGAATDTGADTGTTGGA